jgi:hypothetical protein
MENYFKKLEVAFSDLHQFRYVYFRTRAAVAIRIAYPKVRSREIAEYLTARETKNITQQAVNVWKLRLKDEAIVAQMVEVLRNELL